MTATTASFQVLDAADARKYADFPLCLTINDPDGCLGNTPRICLHRSGRVPEIIERSVLLDRNGKGRFFGWSPVDLERITVMPGENGRKAQRMPAFQLRRPSLLEMTARFFLSQPLETIRLFRILAAGSIKGFQFRFVRLCDGLSAPAYDDWVRMIDARDMREHPPCPPEQLSAVEILVSIAGDSARAADTRLSLARQGAPNIREIAFAELPAAIAASSPTTLWMHLQAGTQLHPDAMTRLIAALSNDPSSVAIYGDEDIIDQNGKRTSPFFKPAWNLPLAETNWLQLDGTLVRLSALRSIDATSRSVAELVTAAAGQGRILHLPEVLVHKSFRSRAPSSRPLPTGKSCGVSIIIPTRDRADLLRSCLEGLFDKTNNTDLDVIVIDNDSKEAKTFALFAEYEKKSRIERVPMPGPFNFSRACNLGVAKARHDHILLLNNDVVPINPDWLDQMMAELDDPCVGAVGAFLLFPDGYAQHAGVTLGAGSVARHSFHFRHPRDGRDLGLMKQRREVSAVTAACLLTRRSLWRDVGGMDEDNLTVAFNDVDYCLKVREAGYHVMWTPHARLVHHESVSRGADDTPEKRARFASEESFMHRRWGPHLTADPFYNPNLSLIAGDFVLETRPRDRSARMATLNP